MQRAGAPPEIYIVLALVNYLIFKYMFVSVCGTQPDYSVTSTQDTTTRISKEDVYYIHSKEDFDCADAMILDEKEWIMTGWNNPRKINLPKSKFVIQRRNLIRNSLPRKMRESHSFN